MLLQKLDKRTYEILIVSLFILWCLIPTFTNSAFQSNKLLWFITLYSFAGYVRLYGLNEKLTGKHYVIIWLVFSALRYLSCVALIVIGTKYHIASEHSLYFYKQQSVLTFVSALALFMAFEKTQIGYSKIINTIASATFGVYLIHDNNIIRPLIWQDLFKNSRYQDSAFIIPYSIIVVIAIFVVCSLIDLLRQILIERPFMLLVTRYSERLIKPWKSLYSVVTKLVFGEKE